MGDAGEKETRPEIGDWREAIKLLCRYDPARVHLDELLEGRLPLRIRWLVMEVFRQWLVIDGLLAGRMKRKPRPVAHAILRLALAECLYREPELHSRIVHHAVETGKGMGLKPAECGFLNGLLRAILRSGKLEGKHLVDSHPQWLVQSWKKAMGEEAAEKLLEWNQSVPSLTVSAKECPSYAEPTEWEGFFRISKGRFSDALDDLRSGRAYMQDPFTRIPVDLLKVQPGESVLDLCAAPGGKSRKLAAKMNGKGNLFLVDRPGPRLERLRQNANFFHFSGLEIIGSDLENLSKTGPKAGLVPASMDAILIDVPCSNTGVIQKRPDVKVRLKEETIGDMAKLQLKLLQLAGEWAQPGGRLVYSTCSLETEENDGVVEAFLESNPQWQLKERIISYPWECSHDGGGAFLLTKSSLG